MTMTTCRMSVHFTDTRQWVLVTKNTPLDKRTGWKFSFQNTKSGAGLQFLLLDRMAKASAKGELTPNVQSKILLNPG